MHELQRKKILLTAGKGGRDCFALIMTQQNCIKRRVPPKLPFYFIVLVKEQLIDLTSSNLQMKDKITKKTLKLS